MTILLFAITMCCLPQEKFDATGVWTSPDPQYGDFLQVADVGDFDGDGFSDMAVNGGPGTSLVARVRIVSGVDGRVEAILTADPSHASRLGFGRCVRTATAYGAAKSRLTISDMGAPGNGTSGGSVEIFDLPTLRHVGSIGGDDNSNFGMWMESDRDLNGDGFDEIAVASPNAKVSDGSRSGDVRVFDGVTLQEMFRFEGVNGEHLAGPLAFLDDMDGDGTPDLAIGSPWYGTNYQGRIVIVSGATGQTLWEKHGKHANSTLGEYLGRIGDIDGDGRSEFATVRESLQKFQVYGGSPPRLMYELDYAADLGCRVTTICGVGDHDDDGVPDIVVAGYQPIQTAPMRMRLLSGRDGAIIQKIESPLPYSSDLFGWQVVQSGDFSGDGSEDLLVLDTNGISTVGHIIRYSTRSLFLDRKNSDNGQPGPAASLRLSAPQRPGMLYSILLSTEDAPHIPIGGRYLPLGPSLLLAYSLQNPLLGRLDAAGEATVDVSNAIPGLPPGFDLYAAWISPDPTAPNHVRAISNRVQIPLR